MSKPKDPCKICPFARDCTNEGEDRRWCFVRILTLEAWERAEDLQRRKQLAEEKDTIAKALGYEGARRIVP